MKAYYSSQIANAIETYIKENGRIGKFDRELGYARLEQIAMPRGQKPILLALFLSAVGNYYVLRAQFLERLFTDTSIVDGYHVKVSSIPKILERINKEISVGHFEMDDDGEIYYRYVVDCNHCFLTSQMIDESINTALDMFIRYGEELSKPIEEAIKVLESMAAAMQSQEDAEHKAVNGDAAKLPLAQNEESSSEKGDEDAPREDLEVFEHFCKNNLPKIMDSILKDVEEGIPEAEEFCTHKYGCAVPGLKNVEKFYLRFESDSTDVEPRRIQVSVEVKLRQKQDDDIYTSLIAGRKNAVLAYLKCEDAIAEIKEAIVRLDKAAAAPGINDQDRNHDGYEDLLASIRDEFAKNVKNGDTPIFTTDASYLYELFLQYLPVNARQHYNCNACRTFVNQFGGLVCVNEKTGEQTPVMWNTNVPDFFAEAVNNIRMRVKAAKITGVFVTKNRQLGTPHAGGWKHMAVDMPESTLRITKFHTASQISAEKAEEYRLLCDAIKKYRVETVQTAVNLLRSDALYRSEKVLGVAEWFLGIHQAIKGSRYADNILWYKASIAPVGFCHVSSSMIGTLLDDIEAGLDFNTVSRKFADKMNPLKYQRPQAAPAAGNVVQAEKVVERLGIEDSLKRRFARLEELETLWKPRPEKKDTWKPSGIFANIETKIPHKKAIGGFEVPAGTMTWEKFQRMVLPTARKIEFLVPDKAMSYSAILTAADLSAPPILQWDTEEKRNPFSWYVYNGGSRPASWNLKPGYVEVTGVVLQPNMWTAGFEHHGKAVFFILKDAKDNNYRTSGNALFPENLKPELHEIRSTIEAYSKRAILGGALAASACGLRLQAGSSWNARFRVTSDVGTAIYTLDRWD